MKRFICGIALLTFAVYFLMPMGVGHLQQESTYAKWGKVAFEKVMERYPNSEAIEYEYEGRKHISDTKSQDSFRFVIKQAGTKKPVLVQVTFNPKTDKLLTVHSKELSS